MADIEIRIERIGNQEIQDAIKDNDGYCICAVSKNEDTKCMCKEFREQQTSGTCHCGLYKKTIS